MFCGRGEWRCEAGWTRQDDSKRGTGEDRAVQLGCADFVRAMPTPFLDLRAVCTSWDSGELDPVAAGMSGWQLQGAHAVSPPIEVALAEAWPVSPCGRFDEWYFFADVPAFGELHPICNWGLSLAEAGDLPGVPSGFDLEKQLDRYEPRVVLGDGQRLFMVSRDERLVAGFAEECARRRTRG